MSNPWCCTGNTGTGKERPTRAARAANLCSPQGAPTLRPRGESGAAGGQAGLGPAVGTRRPPPPGRRRRCLPHWPGAAHRLPRPGSLGPGRSAGTTELTAGSAHGRRGAGWSTARNGPALRRPPPRCPPVFPRPSPGAKFGQRRLSAPVLPGPGQKAHIDTWWAPGFINGTGAGRKAGGTQRRRVPEPRRAPGGSRAASPRRGGGGRRRRRRGRAGGTWSGGGGRAAEPGAPPEPGERGRRWSERRRRGEGSEEGEAAGGRSLPPPPSPHRHRLLGAPQCWGARVGRRSRSLPGVGAAGAGGDRGRCRAEGKDGAGRGGHGRAAGAAGVPGTRRPPQSLLAAWVGGGFSGNDTACPTAERAEGRRLPAEHPPRDPPPRPATIATHAAAGAGTARVSPLPRARPRAAASGVWGESEVARGPPGKSRWSEERSLAWRARPEEGGPGGRGEPGSGRGCGRLVALWLARVYSSVRGAGSLPGSLRTLSDIGGFSSRPDPLVIFNGWHSVRLSCALLLSKLSLWGCNRNKRRFAILCAMMFA